MVSSIGEKGQSMRGDTDERIVLSSQLVALVASCVLRDIVSGSGMESLVGAEGLTITPLRDSARP